MADVSPSTRSTFPVKKKKKRKKEKKELCKQFNSRGQSLLQSPQDGQMKALNSYQQQ